MDQQKAGFDPGLTQKFAGELRRAINKDGSFNVRRRHVPLSSLSPYLYLVSVSWMRFAVIVLTMFLLTNLVFAGVFSWIGTDGLAGSGVNSGVSPFLSAFFFSVHTLTTVGYGSVYPRGLAANIVAALEAMLGLMMFALATGLLFARFSRPSARIVFSDAMLVAPYQDVTSLQFRIANERNNDLIDLQVRLLLMTVDRCDTGELERRFDDLPLERSNVLFLPLTWTIVHPIDSNSPLYGLTAEDFKRLEMEVLILVKGFDDTFAQTVNARFSYRHDEIVWGASFKPSFTVDGHGDLVLELDQINAVRERPLPAAPGIPTAPDRHPAA